MKFLSLTFVSSFTKCFHTSRCMMSVSVVDFNVGGQKYSLCSEDLQKHPGSTLQQFAETGTYNENVVTIDRDGDLFKFVNAFLVNGQLPRNPQGFLSLKRPVLDKLKTEAQFYGLAALEAECDEIKVSIESNIPSYIKVRHLVKGVRNVQHEQQINVVYKKHRSGLIRAVRRALYEDEPKGDPIADTAVSVDADGNVVEEDQCGYEYSDIWYNSWALHGRRATRFVIPAADGAHVLAAFSNELKRADSVIIALSNVYPARESNPAELKEGDSALYNLLCEQFDVKIVTTIVHHRSNCEFHKRNGITSALFTPEIVTKHLREGHAKRGQKKNDEQRPKLFLPHKLHEDQVMNYIQGTECGGVEEESVYLISALQVRMK